MKKAIRKFLIFSYTTGIKTFGKRGLHKIWPLGAIRDWLSSAARTYGKPASVSFWGFKIFLDKKDNAGLSVWGEKEHPGLKELRKIEKSLKQGDVALDIGANMGLISLFMARAVGEKGKIYAFEPEGENVSLFKKNMAANGFENNVSIFQQAIAEKSGKLKLFLSDYSIGDHRIYDPFPLMQDLPKGNVYDHLNSDRRESVDVEAVSVDDFMRNHGTRVDFVKIDVQGAEGGVIKGMAETIKANPKMKILFELWPAGMKMFGEDGEKTLKMLQSAGFHFSEVESDLPMTIDEILKKYTVENNLQGNIFCERS